MPETLEKRITRLETAMANLAHTVNRVLDDQVAQRDRLTETRDELAALKREEIERGKEIDERIRQLVSAMGEWIRRQNGKTPEK